MSNTSKQFDLSAQELDAIKRRAELRNKLKHEFNKINSNPFRGAYGIQIVSEIWFQSTISFNFSFLWMDGICFLFFSHQDDPAINRYTAALQYRNQSMKLGFGTFFKFFGIAIAPILIFGYVYGNKWVSTHFWSISVNFLIN